MDKWDKWIIPAIFLVLGYLLDFTQPWVRSYFKKRSLSWHERRIDILVIRYRYILKLKENPANIVIISFIIIVIGLIFIIVSITIISFLNDFSANFNGFAGAYFFGALLASFVIACCLFWLIMRDLSEVANIEEYREKTIAKLIKLGGNPEDLNEEKEK
jgi:uncharacterized membrane protein